jgi:hypothetical protein
MPSARFNRFLPITNDRLGCCSPLRKAEFDQRLTLATSATVASSRIMVPFILAANGMHHGSDH